jgi:predicted Abi (CAAX) family protease
MVAVSARLQGVTAQVAVTFSPRCQKIGYKISKKLNWNQSNYCVSKKEASPALNRPRHSRLMVMRHKELISAKASTHWICDSKIRDTQNGYKKKMTDFIGFLRCCREINYWLVYRLKHQLPQW